MHSFLSTLILIIAGVIALYIVMRLISKAIFRSYWEERHNITKAEEKEDGKKIRQ